MFRLGRPRRALIVSVLAMLAIAGTAQDSRAAGMTWNKPVAVGQAPFSSYGTVKSVSCPTTSLCVGVDDLGGIVRSTDPAAATPSWQRENVQRTSVCHIGVEAFCPAGFYAVSCASTSLCVAVDGVGDAFVSTNPAAANPTWTTSNIEDSPVLVAISCLSASLVRGGRRQRARAGLPQPDRRRSRLGQRVHHHQRAQRGQLLFDVAVRRCRGGQGVHHHQPDRRASHLEARLDHRHRHDLKRLLCVDHACASPSATPSRAASTTSGRPSPPTRPTPPPPGRPQRSRRARR